MGRYKFINSSIANIRKVRVYRSAELFETEPKLG